MRKKFLFIAAAALIIAFLYGCTPAPDSTNTVSPTVSVSGTVSPAVSVSGTVSPAVSVSESETPYTGVAVTQGTIVYRNEKINVDVAYPQISGLIDAAQQQEINSNIFSYLKSESEQAEADSGEQHDTQQYYYEAGYSIERNDGTILSIRVNIRYWNGGAQESQSSLFINYLNTSPGKTLALSDIFINEADYTNRIDEAINTAIGAMPYAEDYSFSGITEGAGFYITGTGINIVFGVSAIAPTSMGEPEFSIPFSDIKDILIPELGAAS